MPSPRGDESETAYLADREGHAYRVGNHGWGITCAPFAPPGIDGLDADALLGAVPIGRNGRLAVAAWRPGRRLPQGMVATSPDDESTSHFERMHRSPRSGLRNTGRSRLRQLDCCADGNGVVPGPTVTPFRSDPPVPGTYPLGIPAAARLSSTSPGTSAHGLGRSRTNGFGLVGSMEFRGRPFSDR